MGIRLLAVLLLLIQPLAARGLEQWLPCPKACPHCDGTQSDPTASSDCCREGAPFEDSRAETGCDCAHSPTPEQPTECFSTWGLVPAGALTPAPATIPESRVALSCEELRRRGPSERRPPPDLSRLCVWRN